MARIAALAIAILALCLAAGPTPAEAATSAVVRDGNARFQVLTPTLIRLEYAADGRFEDRPTLTAVNRRFRVPRFRTSVAGATRIIRTSRLILRYRRGVGAVRAVQPRGAAAGSVAGGSSRAPPGRVRRARPRRRPWPRPARRLRRTPTPIRGRPRAATSAAGSAGWTTRTGRSRCTTGLLSRDGWYLLDDTRSVLLTGGSPGFATRAGGRGAYQDGYFFGYGHDYVRGLRDLRALTGAGAAASAQDLRQLVLALLALRRPRLEIDRRALPLRARAARPDLDRHRLQGAGLARVGGGGRLPGIDPTLAVLVERMGLEPRPLPRPVRLHRLAAPRGRRAGAEHPPLDRRPRPPLGRGAAPVRRPHAVRAWPPGRAAATSSWPTRSSAARCSTGRTRATSTPTSRCTSRSSARGSTSGGSTGAATSRARRRRGWPRTPGSTSSTRGAARRAASAGRRSRASARPTSTTSATASRARSPSTATPCTSPATAARRGRCSTSRRGSRPRRAPSGCPT